MKLLLLLAACSTSPAPVADASVDAAVLACGGRPDGSFCIFSKIAPLGVCIASACVEQCHDVSDAYPNRCPPPLAPTFVFNHQCACEP